MIEPINKPEDNQGKRANQIEFTYKVTFFAIIIILIVTGILWVII